MGKEGYRTREPQELDVHGEQPGALLDEIVRLHREELAYSVEELANLVTLRPHEARSLYLHEPAALRLLPPPDHNLAM